MGNSIIVSEANFDERVCRSEAVVLVHVWAAWSHSSRCAKPVLDWLAQAFDDELVVATLEHDANIGLSRRLAVAKVSTIILFAGSREVGRISGNLSREELFDWLAGSGVLPPDKAAVGRKLIRECFWSAFHWDTEIKALFRRRLLSWIATRDPETVNRHGGAMAAASLSQGLLPHLHPGSLERATGLPISAVLAMELASPSTSAQVDELFRLIQPGMDLSHLAPRLLHEWIGDDRRFPGGVIGDADVDALRHRWAELVSEALAGTTPVSPSRWAELRDDLFRLRQGSALNDVASHLSSFLQTLSPPPATSDERGWRQALLGEGRFLAVSQALHDAGFSHADLDLQRFKIQFYRRLVPTEPDGTHDPLKLERAHHAWGAEHTDKQTRIDIIRDRLGTLDDVFLPVLEILFGILRRMPRLSFVEG